MSHAGMRARPAGDALPAVVVGYPPRHTESMAVTTIKLQSEIRDRLARVAAEDYAGATLSDAVARLLAEHEEARLNQEMITGYDRLRENPEQWASYQAELDEWDVTTGDGLAEADAA